MSARIEPDAGGHFGRFGGRYVPEALMHALEELDRGLEAARADQTFRAGRPTPLWFARGLTEHLEGGRPLALVGRAAEGHTTTGSVDPS